MATYTSVQDGNWTDPATWGSASYPSVNADIVNTGHKVSYNAGVSSIGYGIITITTGGMLVFPPDSSWKLFFSNTGALVINTGGDVRIGTTTEIQEQSSTTVGQLHFPPGTSSRIVLTTSDGSFFNLSGSSDYYTEKYGYLKSNWTSGQSLVLSGDMTCWKAGQKFWIHRNSDAYISSGFRYQCNVLTIATTSYDSGNDETTITIVETAPGVTFIATNSYTGYQNKLIMLSRNVEMLDTSASWLAGNFVTFTERVRWSNAQATGNNNIAIKDIVILGFEYAITANYNITFEDVVIHNCSYGLYQMYNATGTVDFTCCRFSTYQCYNHNLTGTVGGCEYGCNQTQNSIFNGDIILASTALQTPANYILNGSIVLCNNGLNTATYTIVNGNIERCGTSTADGYSVYGGSFNTVNGNLVKNFNAVNNITNSKINGNFSYNTNGVDYTYETAITGNFNNNTTCFKSFRGVLKGGFTDNITKVSIGARTTSKYIVAENSNIVSTTLRPYEVYHNAGFILSFIDTNTNWQTPPSNNEWILSMIPESVCSKLPIYQLPLNPINNMAIPTGDGSFTFTINVYPVGWTTALNQDTLELSVSYISNVDGMTRTIVHNSTESYANAGWRSISVTIEPYVDSIVYYNVILKAYQSACYVLVDPGVTVA